MSGTRVAGAVFRKDLLLDLRSRDRVGHMAVFAALVVVLLSIALPPGVAAARAWVPTLMWVVFLFTSLLGLTRSLQAETESGALSVLALAPCDRGWIFLGKVAANALTLLAIEIWTAMLFAVFLDVEWGGLGSASLIAGLGIALLGALGLAAVGTLLSTLAASARFREFLLPVLLFPVILPVLVFAARATQDLLAGDPVTSFVWGALVLYDWIFVLVGYFVFDSVTEE